MSWTEQIIEWFHRHEKNHLPQKRPSFHRQFITGHVLADEGELAGALDCFRSIPKSSQEWESAQFNQAILLARLGYLSDAVDLFRKLADRGIATNELIDACTNAKDRNSKTPACFDIPLKLREDALAVYEEMIRHEAEEERRIRVASQAEYKRYDEERLRRPKKKRDVSPSATTSSINLETICSNCGSHFVWDSIPWEGVGMPDCPACGFNNETGRKGTGEDPNERRYRKMAREMARRYGSLRYVEYLSHYPSFEINFIFDKQTVYSGNRSGNYDIHFLSLGYFGEGPRYARAFLDELGFSMTPEQISAIKPGAILCREGGNVVVRYDR